MAPNLILKAGFVRGDYDSNEEAVTKCRTDFILRNVYCHLINKCGSFQTQTAVNYNEERILIVYKELIEEFRDSYTGPIKAMLKRMKTVSVDSLPELVISVSAELFSEGITWSRMIGFFVFVGELALNYIPIDKSGYAKNKIYEGFSRHVKETLSSWVQDNGGWEGVECLTIRNDSSNVEGTTTSNLNTSKSSDQVWYKNVASGAFRIVNTLFQLTSPNAQSYA